MKRRKGVMVVKGELIYETIDAARSDHQETVRSAEGLRRAVLELHRPESGDGGRPVCDGCEFDGYEGEPPAWPCTTYKMARDWK